VAGIAQVAVEQLRRQEDRSATGTPLFLFPFFSPLFSYIQFGATSWKNISGISN
jgi:hypothetical protein